MRKFSLILVLSFLLSSCVFRPNYTRPCVEVPETWRFADNEGDTLCNVRFWEQFHDPVLDELIQEALRNNYDLKIAIARVKEFYGLLGVASSPLYPQLDGDFNKTRQQISLNNIPMDIPQLRRFDIYSALFNLAYEVDIWGKIHSASDAALADLLSQIEARRVVVLTLVSNVANSYIRLRQFDRQLEISQETLHSREEAERIAKARYDEGFTSELELKQAESETQSAQIAIKRIEISIGLEENLLSILLGRNPQEIPRGLALEELWMPPRVPLGMPADLLNRRPDIREAEQRLSAAVSRVGEAEAAFFPDLTLYGQYGNQSSKMSNLLVGRAVTWQYVIDLFQPIFTGFRLESQLEIADAIKDENLNAYYQTILRAFKEVNDALITHQKIVESVVYQQEQVVILRDYLRLAKLQYENGQTEYLNVLDAERRLFESQLELAQAQSESFTSLVDLYKALGGGWVTEADNQVLANE